MRITRPAARLHLEPLLAVVLWGGIYPGAKLGLREIPVLSFTYLRLVMAAALLAALSRRAAAGAHPRGVWRLVAEAGIAQAAFQVLLVAGLRQTTAGTSAILLATSPLLTAGWLALRERKWTSAPQWIGLVLGLTGVAMVVLRGGAILDRTHTAGALLSLAAAGAWVWYSLAVAPLVGAVGTVRATGWAMAVAVLLITPIALAGLGDLPWRTVSWQAWAGLAYGATAGMVAAMTLWGRSVHRLGPAETMIYAYLEPVSAVVIAALLLGESLTPMQVVGALIAFAGVWSSGRSPQQGRAHGQAR